MEKQKDRQSPTLPRRQTFDLISMQIYARKREDVQLGVVGNLRRERRERSLSSIHPSTSPAFCAL